MYINKSRFKIRNGYGLFTIPKDIFNGTNWGHGNLIWFWKARKGVIQLKRILGKEQYQERKEKGELKYNKEFCKKIAKFGGEGDGTLGIKTFPRPLLAEFKLKNNQTIYFLPAKYTWLQEICPEQTGDVVFIAFDQKHLKWFDKPPKEDREEQEREYKEWLKKEYELPFFNKRLEISEKNSDRSKRKMARKNDVINRDKILGLKELIGRLEKGLKKVESSMHPKKEEIIKDVKKNIRELKSKVEELEKNPVKMFKEW